MKFLFLGRRGVGKTTILNALVGERVFDDDGGQALQRHHTGGISYAEVPGFHTDGAGLVEAFAAGMTEGLKWGDDGLKIVFVVALGVGGRVDPADCALVRLVLDALQGGGGGVPYGIVVNKVNGETRDSFHAEPAAWERARARLSLGRPTAYVHLYDYIEALDGEGGALRAPTFALRRFLDLLPSIRIKPDEVRDVNPAEIDSLRRNQDSMLQAFDNASNAMWRAKFLDQAEFTSQRANTKEDQDKLFRVGRKRQLATVSSVTDGLRSARLKAEPGFAEQTASLSAGSPTRGGDAISAEPSKELWKLSLNGVRPLLPHYPLTPSSTLCFYLRGDNQEGLHVEAPQLPSVEEISMGISVACGDLGIVGYWDDSRPSAVLILKDGVETALRMHLVGVEEKVIMGGSWTEVNSMCLPSPRPNGCHPQALLIEAHRQRGCSITFHRTLHKLFEAAVTATATSTATAIRNMPEGNRSKQNLPMRRYEEKMSPSSKNRGNSDDDPADSRSEEQLLDELRAILPDASSEELEQILRENKLASQNARGSNPGVAAASYAVEAEWAAFESSMLRGSQTSSQPIQPPRSRPGLFGAADDPIESKIRHMEAMDQVQGRSNENLDYNLREYGKNEGMEQEYQKGKQTLALTGIERRTNEVPSKMVMRNSAPGLRKNITANAITEALDAGSRLQPDDMQYIIAINQTNNDRRYFAGRLDEYDRPAVEEYFRHCGWKISENRMCGKGMKCYQITDEIIQGGDMILSQTQSSKTLPTVDETVSEDGRSNEPVDVLSQLVAEKIAEQHVSNSQEKSPLFTTDTAPDLVVLGEIVDGFIQAGADAEAIDEVTSALIRDNGIATSFDVPVFCLTTLLLMARQSEENRREIIFGATLDAIIETMQLYSQKSVEIQKKACELLWILSLDHNIRVHVAKSGGSCAILNAISVHIDKGKLQAMALGALKVLSSDTTCKQTLHSENASFIVAESMQKHMHNSTIQCEGNAILGNLAVNDADQVVRPVTEIEVKAVVDGIIANPGSLEVHEAACSTLMRLASSPANVHLIRSNSSSRMSLNLAFEQNPEILGTTIRTLFSQLGFDPPAITKLQDLSWQRGLQQGAKLRHSSMKILLIGRVGVGKTTILNALVGERTFKHSSVRTLQLHEAKGVVFINTPGFDASDQAVTHSAAEMIKGFKLIEDDFKLVFVVTLEEDGLVNPADAVIMKLVLDVLPVMPNSNKWGVSYGIIINKITKEMRDSFNTEPVTWDRVKAYLNVGHPPTAYLHLCDYVEEFDTKENVLHSLTFSLHRFLEILPSICIKPDKVRDVNSAELESLLRSIDKSSTELRNNVLKLQDEDRAKLQAQQDKIEEDQGKLFRVRQERKLVATLSVSDYPKSTNLTVKPSSIKQSSELSPGLVEFLSHSFGADAAKVAKPSKKLWKLSLEDLCPLPSYYPLAPSKIGCLYLRGDDQKELHLDSSSLPSIQEIALGISIACKDLGIVGYWDDKNPSVALVLKDGVEMTLRMHLVGLEEKVMMGGLWTEISSICHPSTKLDGCHHQALLIEVQRQQGCSLTFNNTWHKLFDMAKLAAAKNAAKSELKPSVSQKSLTFKRTTIDPPGTKSRSDFKKEIPSKFTEWKPASMRPMLSTMKSDPSGMKKPSFEEYTSRLSDPSDIKNAAYVNPEVPSNLLEEKPGFIRQKLSRAKATLNKRLGFMTLQSQRLATFSVDPEDLENSDED